MNALRYKDFQGSVEFDDGQLIIRILHIDDFVTTEVDSAASAQAAFEELVDDYLATCKEVGKEPCKPFKGTFNVRIQPELHRQVVMAAADANETMNSWIAQALQTRVDQQKTKKLIFDPGFVTRVIHAEHEITEYQRVDALHLRDPTVFTRSMVRAVQTTLPESARERERVN